MVIIGITGGLGSGKSTVSALLQKRGATIISADVVARDLLETDHVVIAAVRGLFPDCVTAELSIDRERLANRVFQNPDDLHSLEEILHPRIREEIIKQFGLRNADEIVVLDIPLLAENSWSGFDYVVTVRTDVEIARERAGRRGLTSKQFNQRRAAQTSDEVRDSVADAIVDNDGTLEELETQVERLWDEIKRLRPRSADAPWPGPPS